MKKFIFAFFVALVTLCVRAEFLSWCVDTSVTGYDSAALRAYNNGTTYDLSADVGIDVITSIPGGSVADISQYTTGYTFYIEVYNYESGSSSGVVYNDATFTYADLQGKGVLLSSMTAFANVTTAWNGTKAVATPEPTSGLLLLMGFSMLGLKRKKEV